MYNVINNNTFISIISILIIRVDSTPNIANSKFFNFDKIIIRMDYRYY